MALSSNSASPRTQRKPTRGHGAFGQSEVASNAPHSLDDVLGLWSVGSLFGGFGVAAIIVIVGAALRPHNPFVLGAIIVAFLAVMVLTAAVALSAGTRRITARFAAVRQAAREPAVRAGWQFEQVGPAPSAPTCEATFQFARDYILAKDMTEVITGSFRGHLFTAGHLEGSEINRDPRRGNFIRRSENIVIVKLDGLLPELRFLDRTTTRMRDYGVALPSVAVGDSAVEARWDVQSPYPDFAVDLLDSTMREYLAAIPPIPCTIVIRNGYLIACRDPEGSFESISARLEILVGLIERIPPKCWERATSPEVAGAGVRPQQGVRLSSALIFRR